MYGGVNLKVIKFYSIKLAVDFYFGAIGFYLRMNVDTFKSNSQLIYWNTEMNNYTIIKRG